MSDQPTEQIAHEEALIEEANNSGLGKKLAIYTKLSGPGWLQGAITLGGGSLAGAMLLGIVSGTELMWLQPLAMICGVVVLSAIAYVTLSTGKRPFGLINKEISPVLGWAWLIATVMANIVWCMPQFTLGTGAIASNLFQESLGTGNATKYGIGAVFLAVGLFANFMYDKGGKGIKRFETFLQILVGLIVLSFFLVVGTLTAKGQISWGNIIAGFIPNPSELFTPAKAYADTLVATGEFSDFWTNHIAGLQRDRIVTAFATAVGINMTFLLPYSMLKKRWGVKRRGLAIYDLSIGLVVPFVLATACVVIASATSFHGQTGDVLDENGQVYATMATPFNKVLDVRLKAELGAEAFGALDDAGKDAARQAAPTPDRQLAAMLSDRKNVNLALTLEPMAGKTMAQLVFGFGVAGMALSTIIVLMMMNGFAFQELLNKPGNRAVYMAGASVSGIAGFLGIQLWAGGAAAALAVPTSAIGMCLFPIACFSFLLMLNSKRILGDAMPKGGFRILFNTLLLIATSLATFGSIWVLRSPGKQKPIFASMADSPLTYGNAFIALLLVLVLSGLVGFIKKNAKPSDA